MVQLSRIVLFVLVVGIMQVVSATAQSSAPAPVPVKGADMTLYFNGGTEDQVLSAGIVFLFNLPDPDTQTNSFDPAHHDIAQIAQRLSNDVALVPLSQVWPVADERSRRWLRLMRCASLTSMEVTVQIPTLFVSVASNNGRACVIARATGAEIAQLTETLLLQEEHGCRLNAGFQDRLFGWAHRLQQTQETSQVLATATDLKGTVGQLKSTQCGALN